MTKEAYNVLIAEIAMMRFATFHPDNPKNAMKDCIREAKELARLAGVQEPNE